MIRVALYSLDSSLQSILAPALGRDFQVIASPSADRVKNLVFDGAVDVLLLDLDTNEYRTEEQVRFFDDIRTSGVAVIVLTDDEARTTAVELMQKGAHSYCRKPPVLRELKGLIQRAGEHTVMRRKLESMQDPAPEHNPALEAAVPDKPWCDSLIGGSPSMRGVYDLVRRVADLNTSVLITGASGTGKELIARAIHNTGNRANLPFVAVSCGAIPETLIESELFGHEKGAFTGTNGTRTGYFEQAGGGTLFLDEI